MAIQNDKLKSALSSIKGEEGSNEIVKLFGDLSYEDFTENFAFVYGSLRKGQYNYERIRNVFGINDFVYITQAKINNHKIYDLGNYPAIVTSVYNSNPVVGDIMYCSDKVIDAIDLMETSAGYKKDEIRVWVEDKSGIMRTCQLTYFVAGNQLTNMIFGNREEYPAIESGDWNKYLMATQEKIT